VTRLAFCGLGQMGAPMAARLLGGEWDLAVWNRSPERALPLVEQGARHAATPAEAAHGADAVFTMLSTPEAVEGVIFGADGVLSGLTSRSTVIEMSTIGPAAVGRLRERLPGGAGLLDVPVLGSVPQATEGKLKLFVGGDAALLDRWRPVLERLGTPRHLGPSGSGAAMKLVTNLCLGVLMTGLGEALALADSLGLTQADVLDVLAESAIGVTTKSKRTNIETRQWPANFKLSLAAKDLRLVVDEAAQAGAHLKVAAAARVWLDAAEQAGLGNLDYSSVIATIRDSSDG
jgi:3-hydroxyisobutyrate dehydrogenase-like beta-hydroxyacid dehydrogenase